MDLDLWDCFGRKKLRLITKEIRYYHQIQTVVEYLDHFKIKMLLQLMKISLIIYYKIYYKILITLKCLSIGTPNAINFPFVSNEKLMFFFGVPVFKHIVMRL